jgi:hypothetical protein
MQQPTVAIGAVMQLINMADLDNAADLIERGRSRDGDQLHWRRCAMEVLARQGRSKEALALAESLVHGGMDDDALWHTIARLHIGLGHFQLGLKILDALRPAALFGDPPIQTTAPLWDGQSPAGKTIGLATEGGVGDVVCFARFAADLAARGAQVVLATYPEMFPLLRSIRGASFLIDRSGADRVLLDAWLPALSAPHLLGLEPSQLAGASYLSVDARTQAKWRSLVDGPGLRVGLCWQGRKDFCEDHLRSLPAQLLAPLLDKIDGVSWYKVQLWEGDNRLVHPRLRDLTQHIGSVGDLAGHIDSLDLLISVDSGPAHVAGALGVPVCLLNRFFGWITFSMPPMDGDAYGHRSPWYDSMKVMTQTYFGQWQEPLLQLEAQLHHLTAGGRFWPLESGAADVS